MCEFYNRVYYKHEKELARYEDGQSIFIAFDSFSKQSILYRAKPVALETRDKFILQFPMSLLNDDLPSLCTHLSAISKKPRDGTAVFVIVSTYKNGKRRLVLKTDPTYGTYVLTYQKAKEKIPDHEPNFDDNAGFIDLSDTEDQTTEPCCVEFEDEKFKQFQFRQVDKIDVIVKRMRSYLQLLTTTKVASLHLTEGKKEKINKGKKEKKPKEANKKKRKIESDEEDGEPDVFVFPPSSTNEVMVSEYTPMVSSQPLDKVNFNRAFVMTHLQFFMCLLFMKKRYQEIIGPQCSIDYLDIVRENKEYFTSVDSGVDLNLLENNKENLDELMCCIFDSLEQRELNIGEENGE